MANTSAQNMQAIFDVYARAGVKIDLHGEHDIIYLSPDEVPEEFHEELQALGAHMEDDDQWAVYC